MPALKGAVGVLSRILGTGAGAGAGNVAGQLETTGKVDPMEALKEGGKWSLFQGGGEFLSSLANLRSSLSRLVYSGEITANGTPALSKTAESIMHPTTMPENVLRATIPPSPEAVAAIKASRGAAFENEFTKQYDAFVKSKEANAADLEEQMKTVETTRQKELADIERLKNQEAQSLMNRGKQQATLDAQAAKNAPEPTPFPGATSSSTTSAFSDLKLPEPGKIPQGAPALFSGKPPVQEPSVIQSPLSPAPPINRTLVSYDRDLLVHMARGGDLNALRELIRNPGNIDVASAVPNSKFLLEGGAPTNIYGGPKK